MPPEKWHVHSSTETKTFAYCRIAARDALKQARAREEGSFYFYMMAATFAAFTVEGFLNHIGERRMPRWREIERHLGPQDKLQQISEQLRFDVDHSKRPFQTLYLMLQVRDALAHGKTVAASVVKTVKRVREEHRWPEPEWKILCKPTSVSRMVTDAEAIVRDLNRQAGFGRDPFAALGGGWSNVDPDRDNAV